MERGGILAETVLTPSMGIKDLLAPGGRGEGGAGDTEAGAGQGEGSIGGTGTRGRGYFGQLVLLNVKNTINQEQTPKVVKKI